MPNTTRFAIPWPSDGSPVDISSHFQALAEHIDTVLDTLAPKATYATVAALNAVNTTLTNSITALNTRVSAAETRLNTAEARTMRTKTASPYSYNRMHSEVITFSGGSGFVEHGCGDTPFACIATAQSSANNEMVVTVLSLTATRINLSLFNARSNTNVSGNIRVNWLAVGQG